MDIFYLTDLEAGGFWQDFADRHPIEATRFNKEYGKYIINIDVESHEKAEEGTHMPPKDCCYINENRCPWEAYVDEWE